MKTIEVVSAVIVRDNRILLTQRRPDKDFPLTWECPGGKVDGNESHHDALRRELREELGIPTTKIASHSLWCNGFNNPVIRSERAEIFLLFYRVEILDGFTPAPREGQGLGWFTAMEMLSLNLTPGNKAAIDSIAKAIGKTP